MADLALLALFAGLYSVPMYALIQLRSPPSHRARIIAANNILNALFMVVSAVASARCCRPDVSIPQVFLATALLNAVVALYIFLLVPEYLLRFVGLRADALRLSLQGRGRPAHSAQRAGDPGLQPCQLRRRGAADGGQPAADPLHHGSPHLRASRCSAGCSGSPRRSRSRRSAKTRRSTSSAFAQAARGAGRRRTGLHLSRRRHHAPTACSANSRAA